jgi:hypothetical protein
MPQRDAASESRHRTLEKNSGSTLNAMQCIGAGSLSNRYGGRPNGRSAF